MKIMKIYSQGYTLQTQTAIKSPQIWLQGSFLFHLQCRIVTVWSLVTSLSLYSWSWMARMWFYDPKPPSHLVAYQFHQAPEDSQAPVQLFPKPHCFLPNRLSKQSDEPLSAFPSNLQQFWDWKIWKMKDMCPILSIRQTSMLEIYDHYLRSHDIFWFGMIDDAPGVCMLLYVVI